MPELYLDLTEWLNYPIRSGIQRVEGELLRWWPAEVPFRIVKFDPARGMVVMPDGAARRLGQLFTATEARREELVSELREIAGSPALRALDLSDEQVRLVVPEVFWDQSRTSYYFGLNPRQMERVYFLVFDLLPFTHPFYFGPSVPGEVTGAYFRLLRMATQLGFISRATRTAFHSRLRRSPKADGPAFYLGSDGLGPRPEYAPPGDVPVFSVIGTIDPRKNHIVTLEAFRRFQQERPDARLRFYGSWGTSREQVRAIIASETGRQGFEMVENPSDASIRAGILESTFTIYPSAGEGFGLPPVESLWLGTPVIAPRYIPSLENLGGRGLIYLDSVDQDALIAAMRTASQELVSRELREQACQLELPTWRSFAEEFSRWVRG